MTSHHIRVVLTIAIAIVAALFLSFVLFLFATTSRNAPMPIQQQSNAPISEVEVLQQMTPAPASAAEVAKESKTLNAVSQTSAKSGSSSLTAQQKLDALSSMNASQ